VKYKVLLVDDDRGILATLSRYLETLGYEVYPFEDPQEALEKVKSISPHLAILDLKMPEISGVDLLSQIKEMDKDIYVIIITAYGTIESVIEALRRRADDFLLKPFKTQELESALLRAEKFLKLLEENVSLRKELEFLKEYEIIGRSKALEDVLEKVKKVAPFDTTCLIYGETGTGKELLARAIHYNSPRKDKPFLVLNMAAMPEELTESELFGYKKGAFTGAFSDHPGLLKMAEGGTLLLDEISEAPLRIQAKLLRVLEYKVFTPLGSAKEERADVRIIAATNKDLRKLVKEGKFREDLFFRLNVVSIEIPPLRERKEDIEVLTNYFLTRYAQKYGKRVKFDEGVYQLFLEYPWPGNVRELKNFVEQLVVSAEDGKVVTKDMALRLMEKGKGEPSLGLKSLEEMERDYIREVLRYAKGDKRKAAEILGIDLSTLYRKLKSMGGEE